MMVRVSLLIVLRARQAACRLVDHKYFDFAMIFVIIWSSIMLVGVVSFMI
jgi:hypothetical protein